MVEYPIGGRCTVLYWVVSQRFSKLAMVLNALLMLTSISANSSKMASLNEQYVPYGRQITSYRADLRLTSAVTEMDEAAELLTTGFRSYCQNRRLFVINSAHMGGGVAEMIPCQLQLIRQFGVEAHWLVLSPGRADSDFFNFTKRRKSIHGRPGRLVFAALSLTTTRPSS